ncbi:hypothetical protein [Bradyrhizobium sp. SZCCHNRI1073]|uniref:hypothetical protein n=1 Tax=Bradyrhizobium sp. SZCCHNRI1073 TaxID=3057280 RepID=UPI0029160BD8|nr:hypothetical protein [Bradyrhizobium sp. SZCCHNRI1073]
MSDFRFDDTKVFTDNFEAFLQEVERGDAEMGKILRDNAALLLGIMVDGERDTKKRAAFNTSVLKALDALAAESQSDGGAR